MELPVCSSTILFSQVSHALQLGLAFLIVALIATGLDLAADSAGRWGASRATSWVLRVGALCLAALDVAVLVVVALAFAASVASCLLS